MKNYELIKALRKAFVNYVWSKGCSCCKDQDEHQKSEDRMGELLGFPKYEDGSGYDFSQFQ